MRKSQKVVLLILFILLTLVVITFQVRDVYRPGPQDAIREREGGPAQPSR